MTGVGITSRIMTKEAFGNVTRFASHRTKASSSDGGFVVFAVKARGHQGGSKPALDKGRLDIAKTLLQNTNDFAAA